jgi:NRPS condensation-like uncharacterized protein
MKEVRISQVDVLFSNGIYPIEFLFYYKEGFKTEKLRRVLRGLSSFFWPMFGEYKDGLIVFDGYREEDCYDEEVVHQELNMAEIKETGFEAYSRFRQPDLKRLFVLKVIRWKNGMALIPKLNHLAGDGYSYFYFLSLLAALSRPALVPFKSSLMGIFLKPHHHRTILKDFSFEGVELKPVLPADKFTVEFEEILRTNVQSVIEEIASSDNLRVSTNDILSAMAVKKFVGRQSEYWREEVSLTMPIDVRRLVKEYGRGFFGNGLMFHTLKFKKEHIENSPAKEMAVDIRKSMPHVSRETYINYLGELEDVISAGDTEKLRPFNPDRGCLVTNLSKLPAEKLDFGTGSPDLVIPLTVEKNSAAILAKKENFVLRYSF